MSDSAAPILIRSSEFEQLRDARGILKQEADAVLRTADQLDGRFCEAVAELLRCRGRAVFTGMGKAGWIARKLAATFSSIGTPAQFLHPAEAVHGDSGCLTGDDVLLALSNSGETEEVLRMLPIPISLGVPIIAITASETNSLARAARVVLPTGRHAEAGELQLAPSSSTTAMLALGDALGLVVSQNRGFTASRFATFHPGGSLGRKLMDVADVMRTGEHLRIARESQTLRETLLASSGSARRTGALMLTDADGLLTGLFTDSDLARLLERRRDGQLDRPVSEVMTRSPATIRGEAKVAEAVHLLGERKISELPVVDDAGRPVGLIDITDLIGDGEG